MALSIVCTCGKTPHEWDCPADGFESAVPSEATEAGEGDPHDSRIAGHVMACHSRRNRPDWTCSCEPDAGEVEVLGRVIQQGMAVSGYTNAAARTVLASDWLAARDARVRREEGERIAQAVEALPTHYVQENGPGWLHAVRTSEVVRVARDRADRITPAG